jgi:glucose/arabinose dehydrogenase
MGFALQPGRCNAGGATMNRTCLHACALVAAISAAASPRANANVPPNTPTIIEPATDGQVLNPADVHMATALFSDPDPGDTHLCSDWEIWTVSPSQRVWSALCATGASAVHLHLGDGVFENAYAGRSELDFSTNYILRTRHRDSSGVIATQWSAYAQRPFATGAASAVFPVELDDVLTNPAPAWRESAGGAPLVLPPGAPQPLLAMQTAEGGVLLEFRGLDGLSNQLINPPRLAEHGFARIVVTAGAAALSLPESEVSFFNDEGEEVTIYLPALAVNPGTPAYYWVSAAGSTYTGNSTQTAPSFRFLARGAPVPWIVNQPGYKVEIVATGFQLPVNIAFIPNPGIGPDDPLYYVTELYGQIKMVTRSGAVSDYATNLLNYNPTGEFPGSGEQGLAGIVVDPATGDLYCTLVYDAGGPHYPRVDKFTSTDGGRTAATQTTIRNMPGETQGPSHQISNITIGPDGKLYVHVGDGFVTATAQNVDSFRGKILRMNLNGTAVSGNPFYSSSDGITARDYVFAYGFRNPFGGAWRASDGFHYEVENGPSRDRIAKVVAGRNYLWDGSDTSMGNFAIYLWIPSSAPVNVAFVQSTVFNGSGFPAAKLDHAFVAESGATWASGPQSVGKRITEFVLDAAGNLVSGPTPIVQYAGSGKATVAGLAAGPDGLYFSDLYKDRNFQSPIDRGANVLRIRYVGTAGFSADVTAGQAPVTVHFTDLSSVPSPTAWRWDFGDGTISTAQHPTHVYTRAGDFDVQLQVTGAAGLRVVVEHDLVHVSPPMAVDLDVDGDVDLSDYALFADCITGPGAAPPLDVECEPADFDANEKIDLWDFAGLQRAIN